MKRLLMVVIGSLVLCGCLGCASPSIVQFSTEVISVPPGARIELDNAYIGEAPVTV